jgi:uncharacterized protein YbbC (DUF1343 family)
MLTVTLFRAYQQSNTKNKHKYSIINTTYLLTKHRFYGILTTVLLGIDTLLHNRCKSLRGAAVGLYTNIAACDSDLRPTIDWFLQDSSIALKVIFAPEHGLYGALQDQAPARTYHDKTHRIPIVSLYGKRLTPTEQYLRKIDTLVIDINDIGSRYYTFLWSAILLIHEARQHNIKAVVLDRPNPLNGLSVEGAVLEPAFTSFVGLFPLPVRHGMTMGELCTLMNKEMMLNADITVVKMKGWRRSQYFPDTSLQWTMPSPNMPSFNTALVYPGMCLLEGTNVSEGRGTTRPFEIFGAPWIKASALVNALLQQNLQGVGFRPLRFIPTFGKYKGRLCSGAHIYVTTRSVFRPFTTALTIIRTIIELYPQKFKWRTPPYEFERRKMPFDILVGNSWIRPALENKRSISEISKKWQPALTRFKKKRKAYMLYN